jgi:ADP-ribose pyrophosphatase YjhB (NUDIX family)
MMHQRRAGIIPFSINPKTKTRWFCLAMDNRTNELGDFGGGVRSNETAIKGAIREFNEESLGVFNLPELYIRSNVKSCIKTNSCQIFFVQVDWEQVEDSQYYFNALNGNDEVSKIIWIEECKFLELLKKGNVKSQNQKYVMWSKVQKILSKLDVNRIKAS